MAEEVCPEHGLKLKRALGNGWFRCPYEGKRGGNCMFTRRKGRGQ